jgi:hypothetical protein
MDLHFLCQHGEFNTCPLSDPCIHVALRSQVQLKCISHEAIFTLNFKRRSLTFKHLEYFKYALVLTEYFAVTFFPDRSVLAVNNFLGRIF